MAEPFGFSPDQPLATAAEPAADLDVLRALGAKLGQTWPAHLIQTALGAAALPGDVYAGRTAMAPPGLRREDVTDAAPPQAGGAESTGFGSLLGLNPVAAQPGDDVVGRSADLAGLVAGVSTPFAEPGAVGIFGGRLAKTADQSKLARAQELEHVGVTPADIHAETGWFKGVDDKWRFEIPDNTSQMRNVGAGTMGQALEHDPLYAAYPDLKAISTKWGAAPGHGSYNPGVPELMAPETINLSQFKGAGPDSGQRSVALHELQHAVQQREGFAKGANAGAFQQQDEAKLARDALSFRRELDKMPKGMDSIAKENAVVKQYQDLGAMDWLPSREARDLAHDRFNNPDDQLGTLVKAYGLDQRTTPYSGRDIYKRHAGEVEARNVQKRADWDAQRRADVPPAFSQDTVNADQIVRFGEASPFSMAPESMSLPMDEVARNARAKDMGFTIDAFHGTNQPLQQFDSARLGASTRSHSSKEAAFFTDDAALASEYAANAGKNVVADVAAHEKAVDAARRAYERADKAARRSGNWKASEDALAKWENLEIGAQRADPIEGQNVLPVKLRMTNPKVFDAGGGNLLKLAEREGSHLDELMRQAAAAGHDGVMVKNLVDGPRLMGDYTPSTHYAVFDPSNIRSRFAKFDPAKIKSKDLLAGGVGAAGFGSLFPVPDDQ